MNTKMKNKKKSLLAITVVMLLALVAVAGVVTYTSDDSSASSDSVSYGLFVNGSTSIGSDNASTNIFVYGDTGTVTISSGVTYVGTLSFGYYDTISGVYVAYETISFADGGINNATFTYSKTTGVAISSNTVDALAYGTVTTGTFSFTNSVNGEIVAGAATIELEEVSNFEVTVADGTAYISDNGTAIAGTVTVSGTAYSQNMEIGTAGKVVVANGATVTTAATITGVTYNFTVGYGSTMATAPTATLVAGSTLTGVVNTTSKTISFSGVSAGEYHLNVTFAAVVIGTTTTAIQSSYVYSVVVTDDGTVYVDPVYTVSTTSGTAAYSSTTGNYSAVISTNDKGLVGGNTGSVTVYNSAGTVLTYGTNYTVTCVNGTVTINFIGVTGNTALTYYVTIKSTAVYSTEHQIYAGELVLTPAYVSGTTTQTSGTFTLAACDTLAGNTSGFSAYMDGTVTVTASVGTTATSALLYNLDGSSATTYGTATVSSGAVTIKGVSPGSYLLVVNNGTSYNLVKLIVAINGSTATATMTSYSLNLAVASSAYTLSGATFVSSTSATNFKVFYSTNNGATWSTSAAIDATGSASFTAASSITTVEITIGSVANTNVVYKSTGITITTGSTTLVGAPTISSTNGSFVPTMTATAVAVEIDTAGELDVYGTLAVTYDSRISSGYNTITTAGEVYTYGTLTIAYANGTVAPLTSGINGVYYLTGSAQPYTYTYTTMSAALSASGNVTELGAIYITSDLILSSTASGVTSTTVNIVGTMYVGTSTPTSSFAVVTLPTSTTLTLGNVTVTNGKFICEGLTTDSYSTHVTAAVFVKSNGNGIYTTLTTALETVTSGTVTLRGPASVTTDTVLASGVTLVLSGNTVTVGSSSSPYSTPTFVLNGTVTGAGHIVINRYATVEANSSDATTDAYTYEVEGGSLIVGEDAIIANVAITVTGGNLTVYGAVTKAPTINAITLDTVIESHGILTLGVVTNNSADTLSIISAGTLNLGGNISNTSTGELVLLIDGATVTSSMVVSNTSTGVLWVDISGTVVTTSAKTITMSNSNSGTSTINVTGTLAAISITATTLNVDDGGIVTVSASSPITNINVTGESMVIGTGTAVITATTVVVGTEPTEIGQTINEAVVEVTLTSSGSSAVVYGTAIYVDITAATQTALYTVGTNANYLYATEFSGANDVNAVLDSISDVTGYTFKGWYYDAAGTSAAYSVKIGAVNTVYGLFNVMTYTLTLTHVDGATWLLDSTAYSSGSITVTYGTHTLSLVPSTGYDNSGVISATGYDSSTGVITVTGNVTATATSPALLTYNLTLTDTTGATWVVDGVAASGTVSLTYGTHTLSIVATTGYTVSGATITAPGYSNGMINVVIDGTATATGVVLSTYTLSLSSVTGAKWVVDNNVYSSGSVAVTYGTHTLTLVADEGYSVSGCTITVVGATYSSGSIAVTGDCSANSTSPTSLTCTLTLAYVQGATWVLDTVAVDSGAQTVTYGTHTLVLVADDGYSVSGAKITATNATYSNGSITITKDCSATATGVVKNDDGGLTITDYLLILLVVIIAILAVVVVFKMMRS